MREIEPLREPSEALLSSALHRLAKGSPRNAPGELTTTLTRSFRQHHARRRRVRAAGWTAFAACLLATAVLVIEFGIGPKDPVAPNLAARPQPVQEPSVASRPARTVAPPDRTSDSRTAITAKIRPSAEDSGFVALPSYDPAINTGDLQVVRLEMSGADLRLVGEPVAEDLSDQRMLADVVVGRDGTPYALRFVQ
jgi:hypothetical protein